MSANPVLAAAVQLGADLSTVQTESPDKYKNFPEFVTYARARARRSMERNGYHEFGRWVELAAWGRRYSLHTDVAKLYEALTKRFNAEVEKQMRVRIPDPRYAVSLYGQLVVLRTMQINRGQTVKPHSLDWLKTFSDKLTGGR